MMCRFDAGIVPILSLVGIAVLLPCTFADDDESGIPGLVIEMTSNGLPDQSAARDGDEEPVLHRMIVTEERLRLIDVRRQDDYLFDLSESPPHFWKIYPDRKSYKDARRLFKLQQKRDRWERQQRSNLKKMKDPEKAKAFFAQNFMREDGKRIVEVERQPGAGKRLDYAVDRYIVKENGRVIVDAYVTRDLKITIPFFDFYRHVGAFSQEVLDELKKIEGVPLEIDFTVVSALLNYEIHVEVNEVQTTTFQEQFFQLPPNAKERKVSPIADCPVCFAEVEKGAPAGGRVRFNNFDYYFCCKEHRASWIEENLGNPTPDRPQAEAKK